MCSGSTDHYLAGLATLEGDIAAADRHYRVARLNVTRAIRTAITRIREHAPGAAAHLDRAVRTGTRCSYSAPERPA